MKKKYRITRNEEFQKIFSTGKYKACNGFVVYFLPAKFDYDRIGISAGKKMGNAVERNKVKRQVRMMIHDICDFKKGIDSIIIVRPKYHNHDFAANKNDLSRLYDMVYNKQGLTSKGD